MLMTLNSRALQSQWQHPILPDPWAEEAMRHIDYDIRQQYGRLGWRLVGGMGCTIVATRAAPSHGASVRTSDGIYARTLRDRGRRQNSGA